MRPRLLFAIVGFVLATATASPAVTTFFGPTRPYLQASDSPFDGLGFSYFHLEDHEDGLVNTPGVMVDPGIILAPSSVTDSVDGDDGMLDGSGQAGYSWLAGIGPLTLVYTFDEPTLGSLPTHAGVVFTNAFELDITVEAFDASSASVGSSGPQLIAGGAVTATAAFVGVQHDGGISRIEVSFAPTGGGSTIEVDHLQYGQIPVATTTSTTSTSTTTTTTTTSSTTSTTTSTTSTSSTTSTTTSTIPAHFPSGKKLQVKQKKSGTQKMVVLVKDAAVAAAQPCDVDGELIVQSGGAAAPSVFTLDASLWKPIKAKKPEKGCKYRKGPVAATVLIKPGKLLKVVASATDLGVPLTTDPQPIRIELRHGDERHCLEFGPGGKYTPDKKLLVRNAGPATACPSVSSATGGFVN